MTFPLDDKTETPVAAPKTSQNKRKHTAYIRRNPRPTKRARLAHPDIFTVRDSEIEAGLQSVINSINFPREVISIIKEFSWEYDMDKIRKEHGESCLKTDCSLCEVRDAILLRSRCMNRNGTILYRIKLGRVSSSNISFAFSVVGDAFIRTAKKFFNSWRLELEQGETISRIPRPMISISLSGVCDDNIHFFTQFLETDELVDVITFRDCCKFSDISARRLAEVIIKRRKQNNIIDRIYFVGENGVSAEGKEIMAYKNIGCYCSFTTVTY